MCKSTIKRRLHKFEYVANEYMTQEICERVFLEKPLSLEHVPYVSKIQGKCERAVKIASRLLGFILDWFMPQQLVNK